MSHFVKSLSQKRASIYNDDMMERSKPATETPTRTRTRHAILNAAILVLTENPAASLGDVADAAGVARSTLHRYFPERSDLLVGMSRYAEAQIDAATSRARLAEGTAADALLRLIQEYFDHWHAIMWMYLDSLNQEGQPDAITEHVDSDLTALVERGQAEGSIDSALPNAWIQNLLWSLLYTAWEYIKQGATKHEALDMTLRTLRKVIDPVPSPAVL